MHGGLGGLQLLIARVQARAIGYHFGRLHFRTDCIERRLRKQLSAADMGKQIVIEKAANLKATRGSVLDPTYIDIFDGEEQVWT